MCFILCRPCTFHIPLLCYRLLKCHCHRLGRSRFRSVNDHRVTTPSSAISGAMALPLSLSLQGTPLIASSSTNWSPNSLPLGVSPSSINSGLSIVRSSANYPEELSVNDTF